MSDPDRRKFLSIATCAIGGGVGLVSVAPVLRVILDPAGKETVTSPSAPLDLGPAARFVAGEPPRRVEVIAPVVKDAWTAARGVVLGAAWVTRIGPRPGDVDARSAICPHLGCGVGYDPAQNNYLCPCHDSRFALSGDVLSGPSERGLDALPVSVSADGRLLLTWERYKIGQATKERA
ncbi:MAG: ubiquinol-cytochrome c reductase iron-sulfur subunit [Deltaproteobacteria bacterium]|nr:ubiquinol-cytochrome c reductase iron-sulfur subunit [Deltaproteobacteria bacterium]MCW5806531.1 ubiquinol-cytochrome c reductase iron-sulfur subunit [Deltaproteobacteria bacterium]